MDRTEDDRMTLPGWSPTAKDMTNIMLACVLTVVIVSAVAVQLLDLGRTAVLLVALVMAALLGTVLLAKVLMATNHRHSRKRFLGWREEGVEAIAAALDANHVGFQRQGPEGVVMETFVIGSEHMTIVVQDLLGAGLFVMVGPVDEFNKVSLESLQRIVDGALAPVHGVDGTSGAVRKVRWHPSTGNYTWWISTVPTAPLFVVVLYGYLPLDFVGLFPAVVTPLLFYAGMYALIVWKLGDEFDYALARWRMPADEAERRLARAMAARGVRPRVEREGESLTFDLSPLSIVVTKDSRNTWVSVGPSNRENRSRVEALKAFVEIALEPPHHDEGAE